MARADSHFATLQDRIGPVAPTGPRSIAGTQVTEWVDGAMHPRRDSLAAEEPMEIRIGGRAITVTMRTPGEDTELAAGFLWTEGLIESPEQLVSVRQCSAEHQGCSNVVEVELQEGAFRPESVERNFISTSACGVCGKASIDAVRRRNLSRPDANFSVGPELLCGLPDRLRERQEVFGRTGGLHAAAVFDGQGNLLALREDIGRHNAVDKVIGWAVLEGRIPLAEHVMLVSGRGGFEIVQKALAAGIPVLASVSAPSSLAVRLAREFDQTLVGFLRGRRFVVYSGASRITMESI
jgi:FdhD protein